MKKFLLSSLLFSAFLFSIASAHQPRITRDQTGPFVVSNPEVSQAFYSELRGQEDVYQITNDTGFLLYANIVVPAVSGAKEDFSFTVSRGDVVLATLNGTTFTWTDFYEPFAGDAYYSGPSVEQEVGPGTYTIKVDNPSHAGKYSLAIGKIESFPLDETINTFKLLPLLKTYFFGKPAIMMFWNYIGASIGIMLVLLILVILLTRTIIKKFHHKK